MKYLLIITIFLLSSCKSEVSYEDLSSRNSLNKKNKELSLINFTPQIEMMIIFLWPKDLEPEDEDEVIQVITTSRKIAEDKDKYLKQLYTLQLAYDSNHCDCHLVGLCDDDMEMDDDIMLQCDEVTVKQDENNQILANLTLDHELIKEQLKKVGAVNIDVGFDDDKLDIGSFDFSSNVIRLNKFKYLDHLGPLEFSINTYFNQELKADFIFNIDNEVFTGDLGISNKQYNVIFSGEIETNSGQKGLIYWEHLK